jgi:hypothetical protein
MSPRPELLCEKNSYLKQPAALTIGAVYSRAPSVSSVSPKAYVLELGRNLLPNSQNSIAVARGDRRGLVAVLRLRDCTVVRRLRWPRA